MLDNFVNLTHMVKGASTEEFPPSDRSVGVSLIEKKEGPVCIASRPELCKKHSQVSHKYHASNQHYSMVSASFPFLFF